MTDIAIQVEDLSKRYRIGVARHRYDTLRDQVATRLRSLFRGKDSQSSEQKSTFWALKDVSFDVKQGDVIGIIGRNGAGKSTLLKILSRITRPTEGQAQIRGKIASLLEVGTGFHPELTGRENIYLNGAILGMRKLEIDNKFDGIVAFADVEKFIDTPVKRYSSGMYVRLAFAVAAHLDPEILVVDEVLGVGDVAFQKRCMGKMGEVAGRGRTVLFVSHNMAAVQHLCNKVMLLHQGRLVFADRPAEVINYYMRSLGDEGGPMDSHILDLTDTPNRPPSYRPLLKSMELYSDGGVPFGGRLKIGAQLKVCVTFRLESTTSNYNVTLMFEDLMGHCILDLSSLYHPMEMRPADQLPGVHTLICDIPSLNLLPGEYQLSVFVDVDNVNVDRVEGAVGISVIEADYYGGGRLPDHGYIAIDHRWSNGNVVADV